MKKLYADIAANIKQNAKIPIYIDAAEIHENENITTHIANIGKTLQSTLSDCILMIDGMDSTSIHTQSIIINDLMQFCYEDSNRLVIFATNDETKENKFKSINRPYSNIKISAIYLRPMATSEFKKILTRNKVSESDTEFIMGEIQADTIYEDQSYLDYFIQFYANKHEKDFCQLDILEFAANKMIPNGISRHDAEKDALTSIENQIDSNGNQDRLQEYLAACELTNRSYSTEAILSVTSENSIILPNMRNTVCFALDILTSSNLKTYGLFCKLFERYMESNYNLDTLLDLSWNNIEEHYRTKFMTSYIDHICHNPLRNIADDNRFRRLFKDPAIKEENEKFLLEKLSSPSTTSAECYQLTIIIISLCREGNIFSESMSSSLAELSFNVIKGDSSSRLSFRNSLFILLETYKQQLPNEIKEKILSNTDTIKSDTFAFSCKLLQDTSTYISIEDYEKLMDIHLCLINDFV